MSAPKAIGLYAIAVVSLGALLAPWLFWLLQWLAATGLPASAWLAEQPFRRIFNRSVLIVALAGLWPLARSVGLRSWSALGFARSASIWQHLLLGFVLGAGSVLIAVALTLAARGRTLEELTVAGIGPVMLKCLATGVVVALIEETFFRGGLQGVLQRSIRPGGALLLVSAVYSALHFLKPRGVRIPADAVTWSSGFECLAAVVFNSLSQPGLLIHFVSLWMVGLVLGWAFVKTRALYLSIGLHAGMVFANELARWLKAGSVAREVTAWPVLAALFAAVAWLCRSKLKPLQAERG